MSYAEQQGKLTTGKLIGLIGSLLVVGGLGIAMVLGLTINAIKEQIERVTTVDIEEPEEPEEEPEEPPPEQETVPPPPVAPPPPVSLNNTPDSFETEDTPPPPAPPAPTAAPPGPPPGPPAPPPPPPPPPPPDLSQGATPLNQGRWASQISNNYPSAALRREEEGTVGVAVTIGTNGRVAACSVTRSSGSSRLDRAACQGMRRYARFNAAKDRNGAPTTGQYSTSITYRLN